MNSLRFLLLLIVQFIYCKAEFEHEGDEGCPRGAYRFDDFCFRLSYLEATFDGAVKYCNTTGGTMMKWKDEKTESIAHKLRIRHFLNEFWIDEKDDRVKKEKRMVTNDNEILRTKGFITFSAGKSKCSNLKAERDYKLREIFCHLKRLYICQYNGSNCRKGHEKSISGSQCFELNYKVATYEEAINSCESKGGNLAKMKTKEDFEFFRKIISTDKKWKSISESDIPHIVFTHKLRATWVGIRYVNNKWVYSDGSDTTNYTNWIPIKKSLDNSLNREECARVVFDKWTSINCQNVQGFICQYRFNASSISTVSTTSAVPKAFNLDYLQRISLIFAAFFLGIIASVLIFIIVKKFSKSKKSYKVEQS